MVFTLRGRIGHVGEDHHLALKNIRLAGDQEDEHRQNGHGEDRQDAYFESRPGGPVLNRHNLCMFRNEFLDVIVLRRL